MKKKNTKRSEAGKKNIEARWDKYRTLLLKKLSRLSNVTEANMVEYQNYESSLLKAILDYKRKELKKI